uniref:PPIase cyclophilin-type domain-containing protein n=1 Tax=Sinocyclocheilus rhinocerous TaxID=307959 RepID=A0A673JXF2_9TELE
MASDVSRDGSENKRKLDEDADAGGWVGPLPSEATQTKKKKVLEYERLYLDNLPSASMYERSYMHRDVITHIKLPVRSSATKVTKICTILMNFHPGQCEWIYNPGDAISTVACSEKSTGKIFVYNGRGSNQPLHTFEKMHTAPLSRIRLNPKYRVIVSADKTGMLEYWTGLPSEFKFPRQVEWEFKTDTDLYEFAKCRTYPTSLAFSQDGKKMATIATDRKVRIFRFLTGKLMRVFDESLTMFTELQQMRQQLPDMEFGRRMAVERELEKVDGIRLTNIIFDETGHFVLYGTMLGIKVINVETNRCVRILGKQENIRVVQLSLFQGVAKQHHKHHPVIKSTTNVDILPQVIHFGPAVWPTTTVESIKLTFFLIFSPISPGWTTSTVFGRTTKGMEVVQRISNLKVNPKTDKPYEDISIINIIVK